VDAYQYRSSALEDHAASALQWAYEARHRHEPTDPDKFGGFRLGPRRDYGDDGR